MAIRSVREHLQHHHSRSASFDIATGAELDKLRKCFEALETNTSDDDALKKIYGDAKESVARLSASFMNHAEHHRSLAANAEKAADTDDLDKLVPSNISGIVDPSRAPSGGRLVPRSGQPTPDMPKVDMRFEHLVKVDD